MKLRTSLLAAAAAALLLAPGCASDLSGSTYSRDGARAQQAGAPSRPSTTAP